MKICPNLAEQLLIAAGVRAAGVPIDEVDLFLVVEIPMRSASAWHLSPFMVRVHEWGGGGGAKLCLPKNESMVF